MRLFTGFDLPAEVVRSLECVQQQLRPTARINWSPPRNLHITTKFIGEWPEERLGELKDALAALPPHAPMRIAVRGLGFFPNPRSPRVFWAGIDAPPELAELAAETDRALAALGIPSEKRAFSPHLTLARIKEPLPMEPLREAAAALPSTDFGEFTADRFWLYHSRLAPSGSVYTKLSEFPLGG
ncbi:MAG TPA: RNA 2',3'-cyclic phosphodiesterase [Bryobacteraceae bacterium]|nr:RNA 2',3'-cyclic phosphodiesterase [Bryobacteraceae bacterium]